jgi:hypothetical protein
MSSGLTSTSSGEIAPVVRSTVAGGSILVAHPIGKHVINHAQANRAYDVLEPKFRRDANGRIEGYGLKTFP